LGWAHRMALERWVASCQRVVYELRAVVEAVQIMSKIAPS
jgi:hypothetical protein